MIGLIAAVSPEGVIGLHGRIPWQYPADMRRFKQLTTGTTVVMGRHTWESLGSQPLPDRRNLVVTARAIPGVETFPDVASALDKAAGTDVWIAGGRRVFEEGMRYADVIELTEVPDHVRDPDAVTFPTIDTMVWITGSPTPFTDDPRLRRRVYRRRRPTLTPVTTGRYLEAPRWRDGRLWVVDSLARALVRVGTDGARDVICTLPDVPAGLGFLPTGTAVITAMFERRLYAWSRDRLTIHADLSTVAHGTIDDMIVDAQGRCFVGDLGFDLRQGVPSDAVGGIVLVEPDGRARRVAEGLRFPNGFAVSTEEQRLVVAESDGDCLSEFSIEPSGALTSSRRFGNIGEPDGICLDGDGAVWVAAFKEDAVVRVDREGRVAERIALPGRGVACVLGGADRRRLFCVSAETTHDDLRRGRSTSRVDTVDVTVPGAGDP